ncbi:MAG: ABC-2 transporter permease [Lachnospiraceae bacterium]|nr:ABC-2 transporter permease [Lachnospiraceae bacterium]
MRGLIYKDIKIFFKSIDKKLVLIAVGAIILLMVNTGVYAGLFASVMLAMTIGMQNIMSFASDEKASWNKYQLAMPVNAVSVVASKYISVICTLAVSLVGSVLFNLLSSVAFRSFNVTVWVVSTAASVIVPLLWTGICLPLTYWFGFHSAQTMGLLVVIPMFYFIKYFEDGAGFSAMTNSILSYVVVAGIAVVVLFIISMIISMAGYNRKK